MKRTVSDWNSFNQRQTNILRFMSHESKNIYNISIFHMQIYFNYSNKIFKKLHKLVRKKEITNITDFDKELFKIYDKFYKHQLLIKPFKYENNNVIYSFIKNNIKNTNLVNDNYFLFEKFVIRSIEKNKLLKFPENPSIGVKHELFYDIVSSILKSIYLKNFNETREFIINKKKCRIQDENFINQVKNNQNLFEDNYTIKYKSLIKNHKIFKKLPEKKGIKSDQNYISRIIYKYYTKPKIPSDLMCNIIVKAFQSYSSFFALKKKGIKASIPKFLDKHGSYVLPYFVRSRKEIKINGKDYYRLTVGSTIADNFIDISNDDNMLCINNSKQNKLYVNKKHLLPIQKGIKLTKKDNYFWKKHYISKKSNKIIESYYIFIKKPKLMKDKALKLIEIIPIHNGFRFKINFVYDTIKNTNKPTNKRISIDLGIKNLMTIYDPKGDQYIIPGNGIVATNYYYNNKINRLKSLLSKSNSNNPLSKQIKNLLIKRENKINDHFNKIINWIINQYSDCREIIMGYNEGWKKNVNMGRIINGRFYQIPYRRLIHKLQNKLELNNQKLIIVEESYTSKCDALSLEKIQRHENYQGKRIKRGLFSSSKGKLINADLNGAINIMRKWEEKQEIKMKKVKGKNIYNPKRINIHKAYASGEW